MNLYGIATAIVPKRGSDDILTMVCTPITLSDKNPDSFTVLKGETPEEPSDFKIDIDLRDTGQLMAAYVRLIGTIEKTVALQRKSLGDAYQPIALDIGQDSRNPTGFNALLTQLLGVGYIPVLNDDELKAKIDKESLAATRLHVVWRMASKNAISPNVPVKLENLTEAKLKASIDYTYNFEALNRTIEQDNQLASAQMARALQLRESFLQQLEQNGETLPPDFAEALGKTPALLAQCVLEKGSFSSDPHIPAADHIDKELAGLKSRTDNTALQRMKQIARHEGRKFGSKLIDQPECFGLPAPAGFNEHGEVKFEHHIQALFAYLRSDHVTRLQEDIAHNFLENLLHGSELERYTAILCKRVPVSGSGTSATQADRAATVAAINTVLGDALSMRVTLQNMEDGSARPVLMQAIRNHYGDAEDDSERLGEFAHDLKNLHNKSVLTSNFEADILGERRKLSSRNHALTTPFLKDHYAAQGSGNRMMEALQRDMEQALGTAYPLHDYKRHEWLRELLPKQWFYDWDSAFPGAEGSIRAEFYAGLNETWKGSLKFQAADLSAFLRSPAASDAQREAFVATVNRWLGADLIPPVMQDGHEHPDFIPFLETMVSARYGRAPPGKFSPEIVDKFGEFLHEFKVKGQESGNPLADYARPSPPYRRIKLPTDKPAPFFADPVHFTMVNTLKKIKGSGTFVKDDAELREDLAQLFRAHAPHQPAPLPQGHGNYEVTEHGAVQAMSVS